jgi:hypothetical protein
MDSLDPATIDELTPDSTQPDDPVDHRSYVSNLLKCYVQLPHTPNRPRKHDRCLAGRLFKQNVPLDTVKAAFILATSRRSFRPKNAPPLQPIRSLAYFLPVVSELQRSPPDTIFVQLLKQRLHNGFPDLGIPPLDPPIPW